MLLAEIHGKTLEEARNKEDYLTSAVFGHLRYLASPFWNELLGCARSVPDPHDQETTLAETVSAEGPPLSAYGSLRVHFWRRHPTLGEPDLLVEMHGQGLRTLVLLIEVKLWAEKSGSGDHDQLVRYSAILDDLPRLAPGLPADARRYLIYLTPREALPEVRQSVGRMSEDARKQVFRLQWQDLLAASESAARTTMEEPARTILADVAGFLRALGLEHFSGFAHVSDLPDFGEQDGFFYRRGAVLFRGFTADESFVSFDLERGGWVQ